MKILVGLVEHIGDIIACEPVARHLKVQYPGSTLTWVVNERYRELIDTNPNVDESIPVKCLTEWVIISRHQKFDLVVDLHVNYRICQHCRIPLLKDRGNPHVNAFEWFEHGALLEAFSVGAGLPKLSGQPQLYLKEEHLKAVEKLRLGDRYCVIHRTSSDVMKDWRDHHWQTVISWLIGERGIKVVEVGSGVSPKTKGYPEGFVSLVGKTSIMETAAVIRNAALFMGVDSGPAHIANALKVPGVVFLGRLGTFRSYVPFTGFYASDDGRVRRVRNLSGPVSEIPAENAIEAAEYV